jgi:SAM-dependent methyltransferase
MSKPAQVEHVKGYFDTISDSYGTKYTRQSRFHHYFFHERLEEATRGFDFGDGVTLDIGAGTCGVYSFLKAQIGPFRYLATDISANMMAQSEVPPADQYPGVCYEIEYPVQAFDRILMLGVTTYLPDEYMQQTAEFIKSRLAPGGHAIITFTNRQSLDTRIRMLSKNILKLFKPKKQVLGQSFKIYTYSVEEARKLFEPQLRVEEVRWLNHTVFPLNLLLAGPSVSLAKSLHRRSSTAWWRRWLSSDFVLVMQRV